MELYFTFGGEMTIVKIEGHSITFATAQTNFTQFVSISSLSLSISGILKEFPDLQGKDKGEIKRIAIERFKKKIKLLDNENRIKDYVIEELEKFGYKLTMTKQRGWRTKKTNE